MNNGNPSLQPPLPILVTGGAGFIGSHVADELIRLGHHVVILDDLSGGFEENVPHGARLVQGSINDADLIEHLFQEHRFRLVYHLAAYAAEGLSHFIKRYNYQNNLIGSINLINASVRHEIDCFVFTSSIAVYGAGQSPLHEDTLPIPEDPYGIAKLAVEQELRVTREIFGLPSIVFRPHNVYGPHQNIGDRYRNVVGIFMNQCLKGEPMTIFGDGRQQRAFTSIEDVAPSIARAPWIPDARNGLFNIGADVPITVNELSRHVAEVMGVPHRTEHLPPRHEVDVAFSDHSRCDRVFDLEDKVQLRHGLERMAAWVRQHGARESSVFSDIEIERHLPPSWARVIRHRAA